MTDQESLESRKRLIIQAIVVGALDAVLFVPFSGNIEIWLTLMAIQLLTGIAFIVIGSKSRPMGKALVYGLGVVIALGGGLGLLLFAVCAGA